MPPNIQDKIPADLLRDSGWRAALFILTSNTFRTGDPSIWNHVDLKRRSLFFSDIIEGRGWSSTETLMLRVAWSLFNGDCTVNLYELANCLNDGQFRTMTEALLIFRSARYFPACGLLHEHVKRGGSDAA